MKFIHEILAPISVSGDQKWKIIIYCKNVDLIKKQKGGLLICLFANRETSKDA